MTSQAQAAAISVPLPDEALTLLSTQKHSKQSGAYHCPNRHSGCFDLSQDPATNLGGTEGAVTSQAQPAAMSLLLACQVLRVLLPHKHSH